LDTEQQTSILEIKFSDSVKEDPGEQTNLFANFPDKAAELQARLNAIKNRNSP